MALVAIFTWILIEHLAKKLPNVPQIAATCSPNIPQLFASFRFFATRKIAGSPNSRQSFKHFQNFGRTFTEHCEHRKRLAKKENVWWKLWEGLLKNLRISQVWHSPSRQIVASPARSPLSRYQSPTARICQHIMHVHFFNQLTVNDNCLVAEHSPTSPIDCRLVRSLGSHQTAINWRSWRMYVMLSLSADGGRRLVVVVITTSCNTRALGTLPTPGIQVPMI